MLWATVAALLLTAPPTAAAAGLSAGAPAAPSAYGMSGESSKSSAQSPASAAAAATEKAKATGQPVPIPLLTTETSTFTATPQGTYEQTQSLFPERVRRNGTWVPVDSRLVTAADGTVTPAAVPSGLAFSAGGASPLATMTSRGQRLALGWPGTLPAPQLAGSTATYREVLPGVDLTVVANDIGGFSEVLVVKTAAAAANPKVRQVALGLSSTDLGVSVDEGGGIDVKDRWGGVVFRAPAPVMWDSSTAPAPPVARSTKAVSGETASGTAGAELPDASSVHGPGEAAQIAKVAVTARDDALVLTPDATLLDAQNVTYPVYVDPTFNPAAWSNGKPSYVTVQEGCPSVKNWNRTDDSYNTPGVGRNRWSGCVGRERTYFQFPVDARIRDSATSDVHVIKATLKTTSVYSASCGISGTVNVHLTSAVSANTTWNNAPGMGTHQDGVSVPQACTAQPASGFNVTNAFQQASTGKWSQLALALIAADESSDSNTFKRFAKNPTVVVEYNTTPRVTAARTSPATSCAGGGRIGRTTIDLIADISDLDAGAPITAQFTIRTAAGSIPRTATDVALSQYDYNPTGTVTQKGTFIWANIPALASGSYRWTARAYDGRNSSVSTVCSFTVDSSAPTEPLISSVDFPQELPPGDLGPAPRTPGEFVFTPPPGVTDIVRYAYNWGTPPPTVNPPLTVPANGGTTPTQVTLTPVGAGSNTLYVSAIDSSGNISTPGEYTFKTAALTEPDVPGDFTGDRKADLITVDGNGQARLYPGTGTGQLGRPVTLTQGKALDKALIATGDFDSDKAQDLLARSSDGILRYYEGKGVAQPFNEDPNGLQQVSEPIGWQYTWADVTQLAAVPADNGDGKPDDIYAVTASGELWFMKSIVTGAYEPAEPLASGWTNKRLLGGGLVDGRQSLWVRDNATGELARYTGTTDAKPGSPASVKSVAATTGWTDATRQTVVSAGDVTGDGFPDLWSIDKDSFRSIRFHAGTAAGGFATAQMIRSFRPKNDFNGDGHSDLVAVTHTNVLRLYPGNDSGTIATTSSVMWPEETWNSPRPLISGDFNEDGFSDLISLWSSGPAHFYPGTGTGAVDKNKEVIPAAEAATMNHAAAGDFNGDGKHDLVAVHADGSLKFHQGLGDATFKPAASAWPTATWGGTKHLTAADYDGDGDVDLLRIAGDDKLYRYDGNGSGGFVSPGVVIGTGNWSFATDLVAGDYNRDGAADFVVELAEGGLRLYGGRGTGFPSDLTVSLWPNTAFDMRHLV
ncbi:FG-GAP-like repeat-containing protein [Streptomyces qinzhouensis]|uniref:FG-GAP-like repeat-containing protein n=1 Tax=Streptomyces qinzhouensis TaxID=2599401 RepID=UPI0016459CB2|nr:FG-GAP-like repeat-containing protein [Streptomyces qinzhouensis]